MLGSVGCGVGTACDAWYFAKIAALLARRTSASSTGFPSSTSSRSSSGSGAEGGGAAGAEGGSVACRELWSSGQFLGTQAVEGDRGSRVLKWRILFSNVLTEKN